MKKIGRFICFTTLFLLIAGCKQQKTIRYELVDGNPQLDYIIQINDIVSARLYKTKEGKLRGEAPFFEGIWIIKEK